MRRTVFFDDFNSPELNTAKWLDSLDPERQPNNGRTHGTESQYYAPLSEGHHILENGTLRLMAEIKELLPGFPYTSACVSTVNKFTFRYGRVEVRARLTMGQGFWPTIWLHHPTEWPPEIDLADFRGHLLDRVVLGLHYLDGETVTKILHTFIGPDFTSEFHTFAIEWKPEIITFFVDDEMVHSAETGVPQDKMYVIISLAVGGDYPGEPDETTVFPGYLDIDYVRIEQDLWHGYLGIENLNLNVAQRQTLVDELQALGPMSDPQPAHLNHWRTRLDSEAVIFEALFNESNLTIDKFKQRLATIFGVDLATIDDATQPTAFGPMVTFSRSGTDYLRFLLFGGKGAAWMESGDSVRAYLAANSEQWESEI